MSGFEANPSTMDSVAGSLRGAAGELNSAPEPPPPPRAGAVSGAIAGILGHLAEQTAILAGGLDSAADAVRASRTEYEANEHWNVEALPKTPGIGRRAE